MKKNIIICLVVILCFGVSCAYKDKNIKDKSAVSEGNKRDNNAEDSSGGDSESADGFDVEEFLLQQDTSVSYNYCKNVKELIDESDYIVSGKIADKKEIKPNDDSKERFLYSFQISKVYKGKLEEQSVDITISSLELGLTIKENGPQAELFLGKDFLFLLKKEENGYTVSTMAQSIYLISQDEVKIENERMITLDMIMKYLAGENKSDLK